MAFWLHLHIMSNLAVLKTEGMGIPLWIGCRYIDMTFCFSSLVLGSFFGVGVGINFLKIKGGQGDDKGGERRGETMEECSS